MLNAGRYHISSQLGLYCKVSNCRWIPKSLEQSEEALNFQTMVFLQLNVLLTIEPHVFCTQRSQVFFLSSLPTFGLQAPSVLGVGRANWAPRCLLWICAFVLLIPIHSMLICRKSHQLMCILFCHPKGALSHWKCIMKSRLIQKELFRLLFLIIQIK